jgi:hypothetical protein
VRDLIAAGARLPLWARWGMVFFVMFMTAAYFRGNLTENPAYTIGICVIISLVFGALASMERRLPGGPPKRPR